MGNQKEKELDGEGAQKRTENIELGSEIRLSLSTQGWFHPAGLV